VSDTQYDLVVIGAGPGGYVAAIRAAQLDLKVCCIEKRNALGGTCLNVGCIPSKALLDSSEAFYHAKHGFETHGIKTGELSFDVATMLARKDKIVKNLTGGIQGLFKSNKIDHIIGTGSIVEPGVVEVKTDEGPKKITTNKILVATGSEPVELPFMKFDGEYVVSSTEALSFDQVPKHMVVIGAGAVGLELGSVWSRLGAAVTVVEMQKNIIPGMDKEMTTRLKRLLEKQGLKFLMETGAKGVEIKKNKARLTAETKGAQNVIECDKILVAVGRRPFTKGLGLENIGLKTNERGFINIDKHFETSIPGIYAIGDVVPGLMLAHKAEEEGVAAAEIMAGEAGHVNYDAIPGVVYTHPELASVGQSEEQLKEQGIEYKVGKFPFAANGRAQCMDETDGTVKILSDAKTDRMLGMHILAPRASDMIAEGALAMEFYASAEDIARCVHAHPTLPEAIKEAALAVDKRALHFSN
jgi:dihydrolipoamide dehydrogenase